MKNLKLSDTAYDILKWVCLVVLPAISTFIGTIGTIWNSSLPIKEIVATIAAIQVLLGALIGISCINYNSTKDEEE